MNNPPNNAGQDSLDRLGFSTTVHCLTGYDKWGAHIVPLMTIVLGKTKSARRQAFASPMPGMLGRFVTLIVASD